MEKIKNFFVRESVRHFFKYDLLPLVALVYLFMGNYVGAFILLMFQITTNTEPQK